MNEELHLSETQAKKLAAYEQTQEASNNVAVSTCLSGIFSFIGQVGQKVIADKLAAVMTAGIAIAGDFLKSIWESVVSSG